jgi:hypothetical protein
VKGTCEIHGDDNILVILVILVGQNVISAAQDARAETDHETLTALHTMNVRQLQLLEQQEQILEMLKAQPRSLTG